MELATHLARLERPKGIVDVVLDTDAYNEIDDQFAIAYLLKSPDRANVKALYAAPFFSNFSINNHSTSPEDGMEKSYNEILHLLDLMNRKDMKDVTLRGSTAYLPDEKTPVYSPAACDLAQRAAAYTPEKPLYVLAIGAITNVASALLIDPSVAKNMVIVWLGGNAMHWPDNREYNLIQDVAAARVVYNSEAALVQLPCMGVVNQLTTTGPELEHWLRGKNALCDYLCEHTTKEAEVYAAGKPWSRAIWDISTVAWLLDTDKKWVHDYLMPKPVPEYDFRWAQDPRRSMMRYVYFIRRDQVFEDLFNRLTK